MIALLALIYVISFTVGAVVGCFMLLVDSVRRK